MTGEANLPSAEDLLEMLDALDAARSRIITEMATGCAEAWGLAQLNYGRVQGAIGLIQYILGHPTVSADIIGRWVS